MARKLGIESEKEYRKLLDKTKRMQKRFVRRAEELILQYPDVVYGKGQFKDKDYTSVSDYQKYYVITPAIAIVIIKLIEAHIASLHPHRQGNLFKNYLATSKVSDAVNKPDLPFTEYQDDGDEYQHPERKIENEVLEVRLYCGHENCNTYIKGKEGYNGAFEAETGQYCDLRNQGFMCKKHR